MAVRPPSLRSIAAFEAAARHASFTKAAEELNLTPGAISHAIKALEMRLDQTLFDRKGRAVALTAAGISLVTKVRLSLGLLSDAFDARPWRSLDRLVISTLRSVAQKILVPELGRLRNALPGVTLDIRTSDALADFDDGVDVAVRFGPGGWSGLQSHFLANERLIPVVSPGYRDGNWPSSEAELGDHTLIHHPESSWRLWLDPSQPALVESVPSIHADDAVVVIEAAASRQGIGLARERIAAADLRSGRLARILVRAVPAEYSYWAVWNASSPKLPLISAFVSAVEQLFLDEHLQSNDELRAEKGAPREERPFLGDWSN
jgi:LysR family glycine cleavage system transcriptional activator